MKIDKAQGLNRRTLLKAAGAASLLPFAPAVHAQSLRKLTLAIGTAPPDPACHYLYYAREKGFYKANGVEVDIKGMVSATNATRAVIAGEADVGWPDGVSSIVAKGQGAKIKIMSAFAAQLDYVIVGTKEIANIKGLEGKKFAVATIGGGTAIIPKVMIEKAGGNNKAIQYVALGNSAARAQALVAKTVDATIITSSFLPRLLTYSDIHVVANAAAEIPDFVYTWEIVSEAGEEKNADALASFGVACAQAVRWAYANMEEAIQISLALLPDANKDEIRNSIKTYIERKYWSRDGKLPRKTLDFSTEQLLDAGVIKQRPSYESFYSSKIADIIAKKMPA
jgi:NitT/TauT family transport system substrate-binding protein